MKNRVSEGWITRNIIFIIIIMLLRGGSAPGSTGDEKKNNSTLLPRDLLFGNPDRITARISPDGSRLSFLAPLDGVLNVWVGPGSKPQNARPVTNDTYRGIRNYAWAHTGKHILYLQDRNGDENWRIYSVNLSSKRIRDLTPFQGVRAQVEALSPKYPSEAIIGLNKRDPERHDLFRLNIETGNLTLIKENRNFSSFTVDDDFAVRFATNMTPDGGSEIFKPSGNESWELFLKVAMEDALTTRLAGFNKTNQIAYLVDSLGRDTAALYALNLMTEERSLLAEDPRSDFSGSMNHPTEKNVQAVAFYYDRLRWKVLDPSIAGDMEYLAAVEKGDLIVVSRSLDDRVWIAVYTVDDGPARYYYYDRDRKEARFLFTDREMLQGKPLARMNPAIIKSRDGLDLVSYYTLPLGSDGDGDGKPDQPLPVVLQVHGGPWARDYWGFDSIRQWLANRGYAVLCVNFRGSTGFGKNFTNAGNLEWGMKMQDDLVDAVNWSVQQGIADPEKIAIMGGSYGGYATLAGLAFTPQTFACGVDIVGPSNLITLLEFLQERSPLSYANRIVRPLLIGQGANDPRVKQNESDQIVSAMQAKSLPVTYVLYADEGHGFARPENRLSFYAIAEAFLAQHLGGRYEPVGGDFKGANFTVRAGASQVPGLAKALGERL